MLIRRYRFLRHRCNRLFYLVPWAKEQGRQVSSMEPFNPSVSYMYPHQSCFPGYQPLFMQQQLAQFRYANYSPSLRSLSHPFMHYPALPGPEQIKTISEYSPITETTENPISRSLNPCQSLDETQNDEASLEDDQSDSANSGMKNTLD